MFEQHFSNNEQLTTNNVLRRLPWAACLMLALALPQPAALAQSECGLQSDPGNPETVTCLPGDYPDGITYDSLGDLTLEVPDGSGDLRAFQDGIVVNGVGADNLFFSAADFTGNILNPDTGEAIIDYQTETGNISIVTGSGQVGHGSSSNAERGIRARSGLTTPAVGDGGSISIITPGTILSEGDAGIEAVTDGGDVNVVALPGSFIAGSAGGLYGIYAETSADGNVTITGSDVGSFGAGAYAETDSGAVTISVESGGDFAGRESGIEAVSNTGDITINADGQVVVFSIPDPQRDAAIVTDTLGLARINLNDGGRIGVDGSSITGTPYTNGSVTALRSVGNDVVLDVESGGNLLGVLNFTEIDQSSEVRIAGFWNATSMPGTGHSVLSDADDLVHVESGGILLTSALEDADLVSADPAPTQIDFGDGTDTLINEGAVRIGGTLDRPNVAGSDRPEAGDSGEATFSGLEAFENSGLIILGGQYAATDADASDITTDGYSDDVLTLSGGTTFTGLEGSRIAIDVNLNSPLGQDGCTTRLADGDLPAADCIDISGGSTAGQTGIIVNDQFAGDRGAYSPDGIVVVDVSGGTSAPGHFVVDPASDSYSPEFGGIVDKGLFFFPLAYDAETQQHKLYGLPSQNAWQFPLLAHAAQSLWRTTTSSWADRQINMRDGLRGDLEPEGGAWFNLVSQSGDRDVTQSVAAGTSSFAFDNSYTQDTAALTFGRDFVFGRPGGPAWTVGGLLGYGKSGVDYDNSRNTVDIDGMSAGLYASWVTGDFFVDAVVSGNWMQLDNDIPALDLAPDTAILSTDVRSLGGRIESGWQLRFGRFGVEPLASVEYVNTRFDDTDVPADDPSRFGAEVEYEDAVSLRTGLGVRVSADNVIPDFVPTAVSLTTRVVNESDGDADVTIVNVGSTDALVSDTFDGTFTEVSGGVAVSNTAKTLTGYLNVDGVFESDYDSLGVSAGFRYQW